MRKTFILIAFVFGICAELFSQQFPTLDNYLVNPVALSPAFVGKSYQFETYLTYRSAWTGLTGAPTAGLLSLDGNVGKNMGLGGTFMLSKAGIYKNFSFNLDYAYHLQVAKSHVLSFGINVAVYQNSIDLANVVVADPNDPVLGNGSKSNETYMNVGFSMLYNWKDLNVCFAFPLLLNNRTLYSENDYGHLLGMDRNWLIYANYSVGLSKLWKLKFDLLYRDTQFSPLTIDFSTMVKYKDNFWLGLFYRNTNIIGITAGVAIVHSVVINYNYEFAGFTMNGQSGGSHEFTLGYRLPFTLKKAPELKDYNK
jgi:type IX secretion system PorP/SprF family membrane protein